MTNNKGKSPYAKYGKSPYRYSELYYQWKSAKDSGRTNEAIELSNKHALRFLGFVPRKGKVVIEEDLEKAA